MRIALALARRGHGNVAPNPSVGCVIVRDGCIVGRGWTQPGGRPHAETEALGRAGDAARGATAYVTLEPCAHHGYTPPCAQALIEAGIIRVIIGAGDPDPRVDGGGVRMLRGAGLQVVENVCQKEAEEAAAGFLLTLREKRPFVTVKVATTVDGKIATETGESKWITGPLARNLGHGLRARNDAILVGSRTAILDNPSLTCRLPGLENSSPIRLVLDGRDPVPASHNLLTTAGHPPTWVFIVSNTNDDRRSVYESAGAEVFKTPADKQGQPDPRAVLNIIAEKGVTRLMIEGGGATIGAFLQRDLVDRLVWFKAQKVFGVDGIPAISGVDIQKLDEVSNLVKVSEWAAGEDTVTIYSRAA